MDFPLRPATMPATSYSAPDLVFHMKPLTDPQFMQINDTAVITRADDGEATGVKWLIAPGATFFADRLVSVDGPLSIGGRPFDRADAQHVESIPPHIKAEVLSDLFMKMRGLRNLTEDQVGNFGAQGRRSSSESTPAPDSTPD